jgi:glycine cleavage system aminomethyltransferase T
MPGSYGRDPVDDYRALTERATLWDVAAERLVEISGPDALRFADYLVTRDVSRLELHQCRYTFCCDEHGVIGCDAIAQRVGEEKVWISTSNMDLLFWARGIALGADYDVVISEPDVAPMQVQGPRSREILRDLLGNAIDGLAYFRAMPARVAGIDVIVSRTGWSGELGYEIYPPSSESALTVWDAVLAAGGPHGLLVTAPNHVRAIEAGIMAIDYATGRGLNPLELWRGNAVDFEKDAFIGRDALLAIRDEGPKRRVVGLTSAGAPLPPLEAPWDVTADAHRAGFVRGAGVNPITGRNVAIGVLLAEHARPGRQVHVAHLGGVAAMEVTGLPLIDQAGARVRA